MTTAIDIVPFDIQVDGIAITKLCARRRGHEELVGSCDLLHKKRRVASIRQLFVLPDARHQGYGRALVEECCKISRASHCQSIGLLVKGTNEAQYFYAKLGFIFAYQDPDDYIMAKCLTENE